MGTDWVTVSVDAVAAAALLVLEVALALTGVVREAPVVSTVTAPLLPKG
jgi:hypothetical protein